MSNITNRFELSFDIEGDDQFIKVTGTLRPAPSDKTKAEQFLVGKRINHPPNITDPSSDVYKITELVEYSPKSGRYTALAKVT